MIRFAVTSLGPILVGTSWRNDRYPAAAWLFFDDRTINRDSKFNGPILSHTTGWRSFISISLDEAMHLNRLQRCLIPLLAEFPFNPKILN